MLSHIFRWDRHGRKGEACTVTARWRRAPVEPAPSMVAFGWPNPKNFNSISVEFADGYVLVTSGNSIRRAIPCR
jgi:hypothetical protein